MPINTLLSAVMAWGERTFATREAATATATEASAARKEASTAQKTADKAQESAEAAQETADTALGQFDRIVTTKYTWDGDKTGRDMFKTDTGMYYYKVSEDTYMPQDIVSAMATTHNNPSYNPTGVKQGEFCINVADNIVVQTAGNCGVDYYGGYMRFTAPSTGVYLHLTTNILYCDTLEIKHKVPRYASTFDFEQLENRVSVLDSRLSAIESTPNAEGVSF